MPSPTDAGVPHTPSTPAPSAWRAPLGLALIALLLGLIVELFFHGRPLGIGFPVWTALCAAGLYAAARLERARPSAGSLALLPPLLACAALVGIRSEPLTVLLAIVLTLSMLALLVRTFRSGRLAAHGALDLALAAFWVPLESWIRAVPLLEQAIGRLAGARGRANPALPLVRGLLLALPVVVAFAVLLAGADLVFADRLSELLRWLRLDRLLDLLGRALIVLVCAVFFAGALAAALRRSGPRALIGERSPLVLPFLGFAEAAVVLAGVDLLLGAFVGVQFAYLFGGQANVTAAGYTYAEYARRGFGELVAVAALSLALLLCLSAWTQRPGRARRAAFLALNAALVGLNGVVLASALMRLLLYEEAYGFTRLRTYTHVAILWIAVLLAASLLLLALTRLRAIGLAAGAAALGFTLTLGALNVDAFIVQRNAARAQELDLWYLLTLTPDALPGLAQLAAQAPDDVRADLLPQLACRRALLERNAQSGGWPSLQLGRLRAAQALETLAADLDRYPVRWRPYGREDSRWGQWMVEVEGREQACFNYWG